MEGNYPDSVESAEMVGKAAEMIISSCLTSQLNQSTRSHMRQLLGEVHFVCR